MNVNEIERLAGTMAICRKAGLLVLGLEPVKSSLRKGAVNLVMCCSDAAPRSKKEARFYGEKASVPVAEIPFTKLDFGCFVGTAAGVSGVCDEGFSRKILALLTENQPTTGT